MRSSAWLPLVVVVVFGPAFAERAQAAPVLFQFAAPVFTPPGSPLTPGTLMFGSLVFDNFGLPIVETGGSGVPPTQGPHSPILSASFNIGAYTFGLPQLGGPDGQPTFVLDLMDFGPLFFIQPQFLAPLGLTSFNFNGGVGLLGFNYTWNTGNPANPVGVALGSPCPPCLTSYSYPPVNSVPEAGSLLLTLGAFASLRLIRRRAKDQRR